MIPSIDLPGGRPGPEFEPAALKRPDEIRAYLAKVEMTGAEQMKGQYARWITSSSRR